MKKSPKTRGARKPRAARPPSSAQLAAALNSLGEGVIVVGRKLLKDGLIIEYANENFCRMSGYTADELTGQAHGLLHVDRGDRVRLAQWLRARQQPLLLTIDGKLPPALSQPKPTLPSSWRLLGD